VKRAEARHLKPALPAPVLALAVIAALAGCGGSSPSVTPAKYVRSICSALGVWKAQVQNAGKKLQSSGAATASPPTAKTDYVDFVSALRSATQGAASALKQAGTPSVNGGKQIADGLTGAFSRGASGLVKAESQARAIPTTNATVFEAAASAVTTQIRNSLQGIASITPRNSAPLRTAANREPSCQALSAS
jgi:hypothetical protein